MRSRGRSERRGCAWSLVRGISAALAVLVTAGALTACAPSDVDPRLTSAPRETSIDIAAPPEYTAAREAALTVRDDSLALLTATDGAVVGATRTDLLVAIGSLNDALAGVSAEAITTAATGASDRRAALAERVLGLGAATLASGRGSSARRSALTSAVETLRNTLNSGGALAPAAIAVLEARGPLVLVRGDDSDQPSRPAPPAAPVPAPAPAPALTPPPATTSAPAPEAPAPTVEAAPAQEPEPEPTVVPEPQPPVVLPPSGCEIDPRSCSPEPPPTIGGPLD
ncbi:hypothetical protein ACVLV4_001281 [Rathayibacter agropyri]